MSEDTAAVTFVDAKGFKKRYVKHPEEIVNLGIRKQFIPDDIKQVGDDADRTLQFIITTSAVDRDKDTIAPKGWDFKAFRKNPVVLFAHNSRQPPIGRALKLVKEEDRVLADTQFMDDDIDTSGFSDMIFRMLKGKFLNAVSVGFIPTKFEFVDDEDDPGRRFGIDFLKQELLEFSVVPVPSNPEALIQARSVGDINTEPLQEWFEGVLKDWMQYKDLLLVPRKHIRELVTVMEDGKGSKVFNISVKDKDDLLRKNLAVVTAEKAESEEKGNGVDIPQGTAATAITPVDPPMEIVDIKFNVPPTSPEEAKDLAQRNLDSSLEQEEKEDPGETPMDDGQPAPEETETEAEAEETVEAEGIVVEDKTKEPLAPRKLKLVSDGSVHGSNLIDVETGQKIAGVRSAKWEHTVGELPKATLDLIMTGVDIDIHCTLEDGLLAPQEQLVEASPPDEGKTVADCQSQFDNTTQLRGEPHIPNESEPAETQDAPQEDSQTDTKGEEVLVFADDILTEKETPAEPVSQGLSNDDILAAIREVIPNLVKEIVKTEIGRVKGRVD